MTVFQRKTLVETNDLILSKKFWGFNRYKLLDKNGKYKFKVIEWFHCGSLGTTAGYSIWKMGGTEHPLGKELTPRRYNPITEKELIEFVKGINYGKLDI